MDHRHLRACRKRAVHEHHLRRVRIAVPVHGHRHLGRIALRGRVALEVLRAHRLLAARGNRHLVLLQQCPVLRLVDHRHAGVHRQRTVHDDRLRWTGYAVFIHGDGHRGVADDHIIVIGVSIDSLRSTRLHSQRFPSEHLPVLGLIHHRDLGRGGLRGRGSRRTGQIETESDEHIAHLVISAEDDRSPVLGRFAGVGRHTHRHGTGSVRIALIARPGSKAPEQVGDLQRDHFTEGGFRQLDPVISVRAFHNLCVNGLVALTPAGTDLQALVRPRKQQRRAEQNRHQHQRQQFPRSMHVRTSLI